MIDDKTEADQRLALVAASQASNAIADLLRYSVEGPKHSGSAFDEEVVELLLDAAKLAIMVAEDPQDTPVLRAINKRLDGWA